MSTVHSITAEQAPACMCGKSIITDAKNKLIVFVYMSYIIWNTILAEIYQNYSYYTHACFTKLNQSFGPIDLTTKQWHNILVLVYYATVKTILSSAF